MSAFGGLELPACAPEALSRAIAHVIATRAAGTPLPEALRACVPSLDRLRASGDGSRSDGERFLVAALEAAHLVAAADGVTAEERDALGELVAVATGNAVAAEELAQHFSAFEAAAHTMTRAARIAALALRLTDFVEREEVLGFATLVALADRHFARKEARALIELGEGLGFSVGEVQALLRGLVGALERALAEP